MSRPLLLSAGIALSACGGAGTDPGNGGLVMAKAAPSGDGQSAPLGSALTDPLRVLITRSGSPVAGRTVAWLVTPAGGSANPASSVTGADGIVSTSIILPPVGAAASITASASGVGGSPLTFSAEATGAGTDVTVRVGDSFYSPDIFRVRQGGQVTFVWNAGASAHTVTPVPPNVIPSSSNPAPPGTHDAPYSFATTFPAAGNFKFFCSTHGAENSGMHGMITVVP